MGKKYSTLLSPVRIGDSYIKNRIVFPNASPHFLQGPETFPAEGYMAFIGGLAKNGAAVVTTAEWSDMPDRHKGPADADFSHMQEFDLGDASAQNYLSAMADEVHLYGSKLILCMHLDMPKGFSVNGYPEFDYFDPAKFPTKPLPIERIPEAVDAVCKKVKMYKNMGYDGITMRIEGQLADREDLRGDEYGSDTMENRTRFLRELFAEIKRRCGKSFIIEVEMPAFLPAGYLNSYTKAGYTFEGLLEFLRLGEDVIDIVQLRELGAPKSHPTGYTFNKGEHDNVEYAKRIKESGIKVLVEVIGGFQDPEELETLLLDEKCDLIGMARALFCDFEYGKKLKEGRGEDIRPCLWCNKCHGTMLPEPEPWISVCSVNPQFGIQHKLHRLLPKEEAAPKNVAVIGGGPAGMMAALTAARRGHSVTIFEKSDRLGGQLVHADVFSFKWPVKNYKDWMISQLKKAGVDVRLSTEATPALIASLGFDAVMAATGAEADYPDIKGLLDENGVPKYPTCWDVFKGKTEPGAEVIIIGGSETGMETAMYLAETGRKVTVLTRQKELGHNASKLHYVTMADQGFNEQGKLVHLPAWAKYKNLTGITGASVVRLEDGAVIYRDSTGEHSLSGSIIICGGAKPLFDEAYAFSASAGEFYISGDCNGAGSIQRCTRDAYFKALMI